MNALTRKLLLTLSIFIGSLAMAHACGTVKMWHDRYFEANTAEERLDALKFIHCQPVVSAYNASPNQVNLLSTLLLTAMESTEDVFDGSVNVRYTRDLVIKNIIRFSLWKEDNAQLDTLFRVLAQQHNKSARELRDLMRKVPASAAIHNDNNLGDPHSSYAGQVREEVLAMGL